MHVANVEDGEAVEKRWQFLEQNIIAFDENVSCISASAPVETGQLKCISNDGMDRIPVLYVKGQKASAEDFCLTIRLDSQSQSRMERSETLLQSAQDLVLHGTTPPKSAQPAMGAPRLARLQSIP